MNKTLLVFSLIIAAGGFGCTSEPKAPVGPSYFIDVHEFGPGKVTAAAVADAHRADLAVEGKHGVHFVDYWVDEPNGRIYCLSEAKDAPSVAATHREAHGLMPARILAVSSGQAADRKPGTSLFLDIHELGAGNVTAKAVAEAHQKDLAVQSDFAVRFINYWVDEATGEVLCLSEAPTSEAVRETHRRAHGLLPVSIVPVTASQ